MIASDDVLFHERHVLVRRRVEDGVWTVLVEQAADPVRVANVGDDLDDVALPIDAAQLLRNVEDRVLAVPEQDEASRLEREQLPTQLAADRSTGSGDEDGLASGHSRNGREVGFDCATSEQVVDLNFTKRVDVYAA